MNNIYNNTLFLGKEDSPPNDIIQNENKENDINDDEHKEFKLIFRKYIANLKNNKNNDFFSDSDSDLDNFADINKDLNNIYLKYYKNLNQFLNENKNLKGVKLEGNKSLQNISLEEFNKEFSQYGKNLEQKLKTHELKLNYPDKNRKKKMGKKMPLTPIPIKNQFNNNVEKKDYKNAERSAVCMRRLEYTHGFDDKKINEDKIIFYIIKGAVLVIEDWWIKIKNKNGQKLIGNKKKFLSKNNKNNKNNNKEFNKDINDVNSRNKSKFKKRSNSSNRIYKHNLKKGNNNINNLENNKNNDYNNINKNFYNTIIKPISSKIKSNSPNNKNKIIKTNNSVDIKKNKNPDKNKANNNFTEKKDLNIFPQYLINNSNDECHKNNIINNKEKSQKIFGNNNLNNKNKNKNTKPIKLVVSNDFYLNRIIKIKIKILE